MFKYRIILEVTREKKMTELSCAIYNLEGDIKLNEKNEGPIALFVAGCGKVKIKNVHKKEV